MKLSKTKIAFIVSGIVLLLGLLLLSFYGVRYYRYARSNFSSNDGEEHAYYIYPGASLDSVMTLIEADYTIASPMAWRRDCAKVDLTAPKPGHYRFPVRMANRQLLRRLKKGEETPVRLTFNNSIRTRYQLAGRLSQTLLLDSTTIATYMDSVPFLKQYGLTPETAVCIFIPNTYEVYWTMTAEQLFERMNKEFEHFWTDERKAKAKAKGLTPLEVATLASIVEAETYRTAEHPTIASLYLNRLAKDMPLQACPTVIFAVGDFTMRRVLNKHLAIDSPYNTYKNTGLPPGPIRLPQPSALDAVLNAPKTNYLYMCANPDFSGTHVFSETYQQHEATARLYQQRLNERNIKQ